MEGKRSDSFQPLVGLNIPNSHLIKSEDILLLNVQSTTHRQT